MTEQGMGGNGTSATPVHGDTQRSAALVATVSALVVVAAFVASKAARDAILLGSFRVTLLPIFIGISAVLSFPIILLTGKLMTRFGPGRLIPILNLASAALGVGEWVFIHQYPRGIAIAVFFHLSTSGAVLVSGFWSIVNERFDVQTAKKHIGRIGMGATLGGILGGVIAERTAVYFTPETILIVLAVMQTICAITLLLFRGDVKHDPIASKRESMWSGLGVVVKTALLRNVAMIVVLGSIAAGVLDYVFKADIVSGSTHQGLLRSLAIFYTVTNVITAIAQLAVGGYIIARLGVPRSVATLPLTVTAFGVLTLAIPTAMTAVLARGAELIVRNSVFRGAYELLYAPLTEEHKRPTKVVLDVGADRLGDMVGAQIVAVIVAMVAFPRPALLIATVVTGVGALIFALRLPRSYRASLEQSLMARAPEPGPTQDAPPERWTRVHGVPTFGGAGDLTSTSLMRIPAQKRKPKHQPAPPPEVPAAPPPTTDEIVSALAKLRSNNLEAIKQVLAAPISSEMVPHVLALVARDEVAGAALAALGKLAPKCTGTLVDALLDPDRDLVIRRRLPAVMVAGDPALAAWGLWRGLSDASFEVRYRCGVALSRLGATGKLNVTSEEVYETVKRELTVGVDVWKNYKLLEDMVAAAELEASTADETVLKRAGTGLEHIFTVLGLVLPAEPLRIALHAVQTDDPSLRGTALEYLESVLPSDVRAQLWPLLEGEAEKQAAVVAAADAAPEPEAAQPQTKAEKRAQRSLDELLLALKESYPSVVANLRQRSKPEG